MRTPARYSPYEHPVVVSARALRNFWRLSRLTLGAVVANWSPATRWGLCSGQTQMVSPSSSPDTLMDVASSPL